MKLILKCTIDLETLVRIAKMNPAVLDTIPKIEIEAGVLTFDTPNEVIEWVRLAIKDSSLIP